MGVYESPGKCFALSKQINTRRSIIHTVVVHSCTDCTHLTTSQADPWYIEHAMRLHMYYAALIMGAFLAGLAQATVAVASSAHLTRQSIHLINRFSDGGLT